MNRGPLVARIGDAIDRPLPAEMRKLAAHLAQTHSGGDRVEAVLFYGSNLRTGSLDDVLDFYMLTSGGPERGPWPRVAWIEHVVNGRTLQAKIATMTLATFDRAASGRLLDTTIWARFVQPVALAWVRDATVRSLVIDSLASAAITAARLAAAVGPAAGDESAYWTALFGATYTAELRVEQPGRARSILDGAPGHFAGLLQHAWTAGGITYVEAAGQLRPSLTSAERGGIARWWRRRSRVGKPLNLLRLARASTTFAGAARYAAWKIERHSGVTVAVPAASARYPLLAAPALLKGLLRARRRNLPQG